jgi:hypothetical protein
MLALTLSGLWKWTGLRTSCRYAAPYLGRYCNRSHSVHSFRDRITSFQEVNCIHARRGRAAACRLAAHCSSSGSLGSLATRWCRFRGGSGSHSVETRTKSRLTCSEHLQSVFSHRPRRRKRGRPKRRWSRRMRRTRKTRIRCSTSDSRRLTGTMMLH